MNLVLRKRERLIKKKEEKTPRIRWVSSDILRLVGCLFGAGPLLSLPTASGDVDAGNGGCVVGCCL
jgi:hypothetical protein